MQPPDSTSFTSTSKGGLLLVLTNRCAVSQAFNPGDAGPLPNPIEFDAIWDTGATGSVITQQVVDACGLKPITMVKVHGVHGEELAEVYLVNIYLPNHVAFSSLHVTKGKLPGNACILIGMDIISQGDFAVTNYGGLTKFSFRMPSMKHIDFVQEHNIKTALRPAFSHGGSKKNREKRGKKFRRDKHKR